MDKKMFFFLTNFSITLFFRIVVEAKKIGFKLYLQKITKKIFSAKKDAVWSVRTENNTSSILL
jgi:hypothetical protein